MGADDQPARSDLLRRIAIAWGQEPAPRRGPRPGLTLARIVAAAVEVADADGVAGLSMAKVASRLGFSTMSLYRYVATKDELLMLALDAAFGPPPDLGAGSATDRLRRWAEASLAGYRERPWALQVPVSGPPMLPNQLGWLDVALGALAGSHLPPEERVGAVLAVTSYVRGTAQLEHELTQAQRDGLTPDAGREYAELVLQLITPDRFPYLHEATVAGAFIDEPDPTAYGLDHEFRYGLELLLDGIIAGAR